jgi:glycerophosphoryl diester phosphodiesterase
MIDLRLAKNDFSKNEKYVIKWLNDNQFEGKIVKQYVSKTIFEIEKEGIVDKFELPQGIENISSYMKQYQKNWNMLCELHKLNNLLK